MEAWSFPEYFVHHGLQIEFKKIKIFADLLQQKNLATEILTTIFLNF